MEYQEDRLIRASKKKPLELGDDYLEQEIYRILTKAYGWLFENGKCDGHWKDISDTALVALCLTKREPETSPWLNHLREWLLEQQIEEGDEEGSWEEEILGHRDGSDRLVQAWRPHQPSKDDEGPELRA